MELVEGISYEEDDDGSTEIGVEADVRLTDEGRRVAEAARRQLAVHPIGVFVSSGYEDAALVNELCGILENAGIRTWRDIHHLLPGDGWKVTMRNAIESGIGFIACFSNGSEDRSGSFEQEELMLAVEQLRLRPADSGWFIPVLLDDVNPPDITIGPGRTLGDLPSISWHRNRPFARNALLRAVASL